MSYRVEYTNPAKKALRKMSGAQRDLILSWIDKNLAGTEDPRIFGKALQGNLRQYWSYRVKDHRILALIQDEVLTILVVKIADRKDVYGSSV